MDETRNHLRTISRGYFPSHAENVDCSVVGIVYRIGHWIVGFDTVKENRFPIDRLLRSNHVDGGVARYILGDVDTPW